MQHVPVMLRECIEGLAIRPDGVYLDGTLGRGYLNIIFTLNKISSN